MTFGSLQALFNPACAFCLFVIKKLESLLPPNVTEVTLVGNMFSLTSRGRTVTSFFFFPSAGCFDKADGGSLWPPSWELQEPVWWFHRQIWNPDRRIPLIVRGAPHHLHSVASLLVWGADASRSVSLDSESVLSADSHTASPLLTPEPSLPSDCESCRTLALLGRLHNGPNSTQPETSSFLQSACFLYPNAIPKVWPSTTSKQASEKNIMFKTNVHLFPSVSGLHQDLWAPAGEGFREPAGRQTCLWSKNKVVKQ